MVSGAHAQTLSVTTAREKFSAQEVAATMQDGVLRGYHRFIFEAPLGLMADVFNIDAAAPALAPAGDFILLFGGLHGDDTQLRDDDYSNLQVTIEAASLARFRVIVNLYAMSDDLRQALHNDRPTAIIWDGHGGENGYAYDASDAPVLSDVFDHISPSVYQYIHSTCHGDKAIGKTYQLPRSVFVKYWDGLSYSEDLKEFLASDDWNLFKGRTAPIENQGVSCVKTSAGVATMFAGQSLSFWSDFKFCAASLFNVKENFICVGTGTTIDIMSLKTKKVVSGVSFPDSIAGIYSCATNVRGAKDGRVCRKLKRNQETYGFVRSSDGLPEEGARFSTIETCVETLRRGQDI